MNTNSKVNAEDAVSSRRGGEALEWNCGICFENPSKNEASYGLLNCDHCFCMDCLMKWRKSKSGEKEDLRQCPMCRVPSFYVVPSKTFCTGKQKDAVKKKYRDRLSKIKCNKFNGTFGSCLFGRECFYAHRSKKGKDIKSKDINPAKKAQQRRDRREEEENFHDMMFSQHDGGDTFDMHPLEWVMQLMMDQDYMDSDDEDSSSYEYSYEEDEYLCDHCLGINEYEEDMDSY